MIAIVDYGVGNLFSLHASIRHLGWEACITKDEKILKNADHILLPGVGAFGDAKDKLDQTGLVPVLKDLVKEGKPFLGICLGMQLLFDDSSEFGLHEGLHLIKGNIRPLQGVIREDLKIPHMGWNALHFEKENDPLLHSVREGDFVYYVHSYYACNCEEALVATSPYDCKIPGIVRHDNVYGTQFHPEKSGKVGLNILDSFLHWNADC